MIRVLYAISDARNRRLLTILLTLIVTSSAALAAGLVSIALFFDALFSDGPGPAGAYVLWAVAAVTVYAASDWATEIIAQNVSSEYIQRIHRLLADRAVELPSHALKSPAN